MQTVRLAGWGNFILFCRNGATNKYFYIKIAAIELENLTIKLYDTKGENVIDPGFGQEGINPNNIFESCNMLAIKSEDPCEKSLIGVTRYGSLFQMKCDGFILDFEQLQKLKELSQKNQNDQNEGNTNTNSGFKFKPKY